MHPATIDAILSEVRRHSGIDFRAYRAPMVERRVRQQMLCAGIAEDDAYLARVAADPAEADRLVQRITIKVSQFFRNPAAIAAVQAALAAPPRQAPLRMWSAGCARGEEAYTLALLGATAAGGAQVSVVGTDVDRVALAVAATAEYPASALAQVPTPYHPSFSRGPAEGRVVLAPAVRDRVRFEPHDLCAAAAPPAGGPFDLVACRNVLIYFRPALQERVLQLLLDATAPGGLVWLGEAEWPGPGALGRLVTVHGPSRLFRKVGA